MAKCPKCGTEVQPSKTWQLVAPLPDSEGRITIIVMGSFKCPNCGYSWRGKISKIKVGPSGEVEMGKAIRRKRSKGGSKQKSGGGRVIEIDLTELYSDEE